MRRRLRLTGMIVAACVLHLYTAPCLAAELSPQGGLKVTTNDPQFVPLSEEQEIKKGVRWYWYVLGAVAVAGVAAAAGGGGGGGGGTSGGTTPTSGTVSGMW